MLVVIAVLTRMKLPRKADIPMFLAAGGIGFFFYMIAFNKGQGAVTASTGSVVNATVSVITALLARFVYKETLFCIQWLAIGIELLGVVVLTLINSVFQHRTHLALFRSFGTQHV
jgi:drug/metabolite transporter (DMT)-like permease